MTIRNFVPSGVHAIAWAAFCALVFALIGPWLFAKGMFWDGVVYATVARNMSAGVGDAWHPEVTATFMREFHEHPPLAFWLQAGFFRVLGDQFWVERAYSLLALVLTWLLLVAMWRQLLREVPEAAACCWLALGFWAPWGTWCYRHNMLENTMSVFTTLSVYASLRALDSTRRWPIWSSLAGLAITAAMLSKGPTGLFPAVTPLVGYMTIRRTSLARAISIQACLCSCMAVSCALVLIPHAGREYLTCYWHEQVLASLMGQRELVSSVFGQFNILVSIVRELRIPLAAAGVLLLLAHRFGNLTRDRRLNGPMWFCLMTALSASLPLALSPKQGGYYSAPSWPYFCFSVALFCLPALLALLPRITAMTTTRRGWFLSGIGASVACTALVCVFNFGRPLRDLSIIEAAEELATDVPPGSVMVPSGSWDQMETSDQLKLHVYLYRYHSISLFVDEPHPAFNLECHRLHRPDPGRVLLPRPIETHDGLVCHLLVPETVARQLAIPVRDGVRR